MRELRCRDAGLDYLIVDMEHGSFSLELIAQVCTTGRHLEFPVLVRPHANDFDTIRLVLDQGPVSVLRQVAIAIGNSVREIDIAARYGGDEFCVLAPETGLEGAMQLAERLRFAVAAMEVRAGSRSARITVSIGVFSPATMNQLRPTTLLDHAETALRKAKLTGKNQVCKYTVPSIGVA